MPNRKKYKISPLQLKSLGMTAGVNASNASQLKKIQKLKIKDEIPQIPFVDLYMRVNKEWKHKGKSCGICGILINHPIVLDKHRYICKGRKKVVDDES